LGTAPAAVTDTLSGEKDSAVAGPSAESGDEEEELESMKTRLEALRS